ncbi:MAG: dihydrofolate reductase [Candidatus Levybacteria bacterium]|nr:dihydrofolate reductase [Candidatus Levybacteria bacterium]
MKVSIIAAIGKNKELGKDNKLIWHIKEDLQRFRNLTKWHPIIMGRKTWDSLPLKPLLNRTNIVITRDLSFSLAGGRLAKLARSLEDAIEIAKKKKGSEEIFIIGGGQIFKEAMEKKLVDKLYLTIVEARLPSPEGEANGGQGDFDADTFFPDYSNFKKVVFEQSGESGGYKYKFLELTR